MRLFEEWRPFQEKNSPQLLWQVELLATLFGGRITGFGCQDTGNSASKSEAMTVAMGFSPGSAGVPAGELGEDCVKSPARRRRSQAEHAYPSAIRLQLMKETATAWRRSATQSVGHTGPSFERLGCHQTPLRGDARQNWRCAGAQKVISARGAEKRTARSATRTVFIRSHLLNILHQCAVSSAKIAGPGSGSHIG